MYLCHRVFLLWRCLRNSEIRRRAQRYGRHPSRSHDACRRPCCHGGYHCHLRSGRFSSYHGWIKNENGFVHVRYHASTLILVSGFIQLGAGLSVGLSGLAAGFAIGIVGDSGVRAVAQQPRLFVGMILILIFAEVLGLYGLIVGLILNTKATGGDVKC